jgi:hypothetical protein
MKTMDSAKLHTTIPHPKNVRDAYKNNKNKHSHTDIPCPQRILVQMRIRITM